MIYIYYEYQTVFPQFDDRLIFHFSCLFFFFVSIAFNSHSNAAQSCCKFYFNFLCLFFLIPKNSHIRRVDVLVSTSFTHHVRRQKKNCITEGQIVFSAIAIFKQPLLIRRRIKFDISMAYLAKLNPFESPNNLNNREQCTVELGLSK